MNKIMITKLILILTLTLMSGYVYAGGKGTKACNFLTIGIGARAVGMGEAYTALADDADATAWNPAGLALLNGSSRIALKKYTGS